MGADVKSLTQSIFNDTQSDTEIQAIVTEHNTKTSGSWDLLNTTADDDIESSRLASQLAFLAASKIYAHFIFKFSITPSFQTGQDIAKNGLHWGEIYTSPYNIGDTTLSAEAVRLLTKLKQSTMYATSTNDTSKYRTYLASSNGDSYYFIYIVNDSGDYVTTSIDLSQLSPSIGAQIFVETVSKSYYGEVSSVTSVPQTGSLLILPESQYSTTRLTVATIVQNITTINSDLACTARAGLSSSQSDCKNSFLYAGTSNSIQHENTSVTLIRFAVNTYIPSNQQKTLLKINITGIVGSSDVNVMVLGLNNPNAYLNELYSSWNQLSSNTSGLNILTFLNSGTAIKNISQNFINWPSSSNISIVGHISAFNSNLNQSRMIDVTDYVSSVLSSGGSYYTFILYRPFRHPIYRSNGGNINPDSLSEGSLIKIINDAQLIHYSQLNSSTMVAKPTSDTVSNLINPFLLVIFLILKISF
jgi:hypothetical protein